MTTNGKGSKRRPRTIDYATWSKNYDKIFKKPKIENKKNNEQRR